METMIQVNELTKVFKTDEVETWALDKVNIEIGQGEFVAVMGPSGVRQVYVAPHSRPVGQPVFRASICSTGKMCPPVANRNGTNCAKACWGSCSRVSTSSTS
mgnify:CR=1 FL=1